MALPNRKTCFWTLLLVAALQAGAARAEWIWHPDAGWVSTREAMEPTPEGRFRHAVALKMQGHVNSALELLLRVQAQEPPADLRRMALYHIADCHAQLGEFEAAQAAIERIEAADLSEEWRDRVARLRLDLGDRWSRANPKKGVRALEALEQAARGRDMHSEALVALADAQVRASRFDEARANYLAALETRPPADRAGRATFGAGWADLLYCRDVEFDPARIRRAVGMFEEYLDRFPGGPFAERARECVWIGHSLREEYSEERREVFFAVTRLLAGDPRAARPVLRRAARRYRHTYVGEVATFYLAEYLYQQGNDWAAFKRYEQVMDRYPGTTRLREVVERQFDIGRRLMDTREGWRWRGWTLSRAIRVLDRSIDHNPSGPHADEAQLLVGDCYMEKGRYDDAYVSYRTLIENYPGSEWVSTARFKSGLARFRQAEFTEDKTELLMQARRAFEVYLREDPVGAFAAEARNLLRRVDSREAALQWRAARFYERTNNAHAAAFALNRITQDYPDTAWAELARKRLREYEAYELTR